MVERLGDAPIDPQFHQMMNAIAGGLDDILNPGRKGGEPKENGFVLLVFPLEGHDGQCNYISNARRQDIVVLLKEQLARFEGQAEVQGSA